MEQDRRAFLKLAAATAALPALAEAAHPVLFVCINETSSDGIDFRTAMEGYAKAGIRAVEPALPRVQEFTRKESPAKARKLLDDLGLKVVSSGGGAVGLMEPGPARAKNVEDLKWKLELAQQIGAERMVTPSTGTGPYTADDFRKGIDNMREVADMAKPFGITLMLEFSRFSRFASSLPTALKLVRELNHPNYRVMIDTYHFWGGVSKFEDLDLLHDGELAHLHFEDVPAEPIRELQGQPERMFPGQGIAPLKRIVELLKKKKYSGPASIEMFHPMYQNMEPAEFARRARAAIEPLIA